MLHLQMLQSKLLVHDYISWRLARAGHSRWNILNHIDIVQNNRTRLCIVLRQVAYTFEQQYNATFHGAEAPLGSHFDLTAENSRSTFLSFIDELFPPAADLPEDLTAADFQSRFGGRYP